MERNRSYQEVLYGERVPFNELNPRDYRSAFKGLKSGRIAGQRTFEMPEVGLSNTIILFTTSPDKTPEQEHLERPVDVKGGVLPLFHSRMEDVNNISTEVKIIANQESPNIP